MFPVMFVLIVFHSIVLFKIQKCEAYVIPSDKSKNHNKTATTGKQQNEHRTKHAETNDTYLASSEEQTLEL